MSESDRLFVGREAEFDALKRALDGGVRIVTIVGPLGAGKTRLATELCGRHDGEACFVDLTTAFDGDALIRCIAGQLSVALTARDIAGQLADVLQASGFDIVVLDNLEQVVGPARQLVTRLLEAESLPQLVVTSREPLGLAAEVRIDLGSLPGPSAVALFEAKARTVVPGFTVDDEDREVVGELLERLDNLPLVIELAAARAAVLPPTQLLKRLTDRFQHIRETQPRRTPRQASLTGAIDWSWDLLDDDERQALARSSVFRGGFSLEAAEAVFGVSDPISMAQTLVDKSLLRRETSARDAMDVRFRHYESIRAYAAERLVDTEAEEATRLHTEFFARLGEELGARLRDGAGVDAQADALARLEEELPNLLAAHGNGATLGMNVDMLFEARGPAVMRRKFLDSFAAEGVDEAARLAAIAETELALGRIDAAKSWLHEARGQADVYRVELAACRIARASGDLDAAVQHARRAVERAESPRDEANALANLAASTLNDLEAARKTCDDALRILARHEDARLSLMVRNVAGGLAIAALDLDTAAAHFGRLWPDAQRLGESRLHAAALSNLGLVAHYRGRLDEAATRFDEAARNFQRIGLRAEAAMAQGNRAAVLLEQDELESAAGQLTFALETLGGRGGAVEGVVLATRGNLHHLRGELSLAIEHYERARHQLPPGHAHTASTAVYAALAALELGDDVDLPEVGGATWSVASEFVRSWTVPETERAWARYEEVRAGLPHYIAEGFAALRDGRDHPWMFVRLLSRIPRTSRPKAVASKDAADMVLDENGYWFRVGEERIDIRRRGPARLLLLAMVRQHLAEPGAAFDLDELFEIGWPGQDIDIESAHKRVYAAIGTLRRLGLEELIVTTDDGYLINPTASCVID